MDVILIHSQNNSLHIPSSLPDLYNFTPLYFHLEWKPENILLIYVVEMIKYIIQMLFRNECGQI